MKSRMAEVKQREKRGGHLSSVTEVRDRIRLIAHKEGWVSVYGVGYKWPLESPVTHTKMAR